MKRRTALAAVVSSFGATAGCMGLFPSRPEGSGGGGEAETGTPPSDEEGTTKSPSEEGSPTSGNRTNGDSSGTRNESSAAVESCPSTVIEKASVQEVTCNGEQTDADIDLAADSDTVSPPGSIDFTLRNQTGGSQLYIPCRWAVYKQSNGGWKAVQSLEGDTTQKSMFGGFETLTLYIGQEPTTDAGKCPYTLNDPSPGLYLFGVQVVKEGGLLVLASFQVAQ